MRKNGKKVGLAHFNYINPLPKNTETIFKHYKNIVVCEINLGQFAKYLRMQFPDCDFLQYNKIQGLPFTELELTDCFTKIIEG
jgi:2-oxoglutarate ferredoxin oxidoreductase subunit alpha